MVNAPCAVAQQDGTYIYVPPDSELDDPSLTWNTQKSSLVPSAPPKL